MAEVEDATIDLFARNGLDVKDVPGIYTERYGGLVVLEKLTPDKEVVETAFLTGMSPLDVKTGTNKAREFTTIAEAQKEGFVFRPYEEAVISKVERAWNRVVDERISDWILHNLPDDVTRRPGRARDASAFGEVQSEFSSSMLPGQIFEGEGAREFIDDLNHLTRNTEVSGILKGINNLNAVGRIFQLAGDASLFTIQLIAMPVRHPIGYGATAARFGQIFFTALAKPGYARKIRSTRIAENADLLQRIPIIMSNSGLEATDAFARGGLFHSQGLFGKMAAPLRPFQQAYEAALDEAGIHMARGLEHLAEGDPQKLMELKDYIDSMRGLASSKRLGVGPNHAAAEASFFLAPRYRRATAAMYMSAFQGGLRGKLAKEALLSFAVGTVFAHVALTIGKGWREYGNLPDTLKAEKIQEELVQGLNPASPRFLMWQVGKNMYGVGSKFTSDLKMLGRLATRRGDFLSLEDGLNANPGVRWLRSQSAGFPSTAWDIISGEKYMGEPITRDIIGDPIGTFRDVGSRIGENFVPLWAWSVAFEGGTIGEREARGAVEFLGSRSRPLYKSEMKEYLAKETKDRTFESLWPDEQRAISQQAQDESRRHPSDYQIELDRIDAEEAADVELFRKEAASLSPIVPYVPYSQRPGSQQESQSTGRFIPGLGLVSTRIPGSRRSDPNYEAIHGEEGSNAKTKDFQKRWQDTRLKYARDRERARIEAFGPDDEEREDLGGGTEPQRRALRQYYMAAKKASSGNNIFSGKIWGEEIKRLRETVWTKDQLEYVDASTNFREIPPEILKLLSEDTRARYEASIAARDPEKVKRRFRVTE